MVVQWIEAFDMTLDDDGAWVWREWVRQRHDPEDDHRALIARWNKLVPKYNATVAPKMRNFGCPVAASQVQRADGTG